MIGGLGLDTTKVISTRIDNYKETHFSADQFSYRAELKNDTFWPGIRCYSAIITIQGSEGKIELKLVHPRKASSLTILTELGMLIESKLLQFWNVPTSIVVNEFGIFTDFKSEHSEKT